MFGSAPPPNRLMMLRYWRTAASFRYFGFVGFFKYPELTEPFTKSAPALRAAAAPASWSWPRS